MMTNHANEEKSPMPSKVIAGTSNHIASEADSTQGFTTYLQHPLSAAFPAMSAEDYQSLKDSIEVNGVLNPITIYEGMVIDGWHRYRAANELAMICPAQELASFLDPVDFVVAQNKTRRHITVGQLALAVGSCRNWRSQGNQPKGAAAAPLVSEEAKNLGISVRSLKAGIRVSNDAEPEVKQAVQNKTISLEQAEAISKLPAKEQAAAINKPLQKKAKPVAPAPAPIVQAVEVPADPDEYTELDALREQNDDLKVALAVQHMDGSAENKAQAAELIAELRKDLKTANATMAAMKSQSNMLMMENAELRKQITRQRREIDRCMGTRTA